MVGLGIDGCVLEYASWDLRCNPDTVAACVANNARAFVFAHPALQNDRSFLLKLVTLHNAKAFEHFPSEFRSDEAMIRAAVAGPSSCTAAQPKQMVRWAATPEALLHAVLTPTTEPKFIKEVICADINCFHFLPKPTLGILTPGFLEECAAQNGMILSALPHSSQTERLVGNAIRQNGFSLQYVVPELRTIEVVLAALLHFCTSSRRPRNTASLKP